MKSLNVFLGTVIVAAMSITLVHASDGTFRQSHYGGFKGLDLDPASENRFFQVTEKTMSRLIRPGEGGMPDADLATEWSSNDDTTEWIFKLREGVKFHDGSDFDAADVIYTFDHVQDPEFDSTAAAVVKMVEKIEALDRFTIKMTLSAPYPDLGLALQDYRLRIIPEGSVDTISTTGIGTGPFMVDTYDPDGTTVLKANPDYWEGPPGVETIEVIAIVDANARVQALQTGQIDMLGWSDMTGESRRLFENNPDYKMLTVETGAWTGIAFLTDTEPFTDPRVRKALRIATDRQALIDLVLGPGNGTVACDHPVWTGDQYWTPIECPQQIEEAKRLLAEAGYPDGIEFDIVTSNIESYFIPLAEAYQQQVAEAGIRANIVVAPAEGYWSEVWLKLPVSQTRWGQNPADKILNADFRGGAQWNETRFNNAEFDALLDQAGQEPDFEKRKALYAQLQRIIYETGGNFIPFHMNQAIAVTDRVSGMQAVVGDAVRYHLITVSD